jgi:hypothetical protein
LGQLADADDYRALTVLDMVRSEVSGNVVVCGCPAKFQLLGLHPFVNHVTQLKRADVVRIPTMGLFDALRGRLAGGSKCRKPSEEVVLAIVQLSVELVHSTDRGAEAARECLGALQELTPHLSRDRVRRAAAVLINGVLKRAPPGGAFALEITQRLLAPGCTSADVRTHIPLHIYVFDSRSPRITCFWGRYYVVCSLLMDVSAVLQENTRKNSLLLVSDCGKALCHTGTGDAAANPAAASATQRLLQDAVAGLSDASYSVVAAAQVGGPFQCCPFLP